MNYQFEEEFNWLLDRLENVVSVLEIGSYDGESLEGFSSKCAPGASLRFIDNHPGSLLYKACAKLRNGGFDIEGALVDSHSLEAVEWAAQWKPYDFVFIDGDHTYEGIKQDWDCYGPMGKIIGLHDIAHGGVQLFWPEIKASFRTEEIITRPGYMGTGIVYR